MKVFIPFSTRSFDGIVRDTLEFLAEKAKDVKVLALVLEGEEGPDGYDKVFVRKNGTFVAPVSSSPRDIAVVNGGPTALGFAVSHLNVSAYIDVQRDGVTELPHPDGELGWARMCYSSASGWDFSCGGEEVVGFVRWDEEAASVGEGSGGTHTECDVTTSTSYSWRLARRRGEGDFVLL